MNRPVDRPRTFNLRRLLITAGLLILVSMALLFFGRDVVREVVVIPLSYLLWGFRILVQTTPQIFFWIAALLVASLIIYHSLSGRRKPVANGPTFAPPGMDDQPVFTTGRAVFWANKANLLVSRRSGYAESNSHQAVVRLLVDTLAYRYRLPTRAIEEQVRDGSLNIPPQVMEYLRSHLVRTEQPAVGFWALTWRSLVEWAQSVWQKLTAGPAKPQPVTLGAELETILDYMEKELEVSHS